MEFRSLNGSAIPAIGFGTWRSVRGKAEKAVSVALEHGYRHIDGASIYMNEEEIGHVYASFFKKAKKIDRSSVFITSKLWNSDHHPDDVGPACQQTLKDLQLDYLDLYLMHWPIAFKRGPARVPVDENKRVQLEHIPIAETWKAMEALVDQKKVRNIGVSNFSIEQLLELLKNARIPPAVNQVEVHPYFPQNELVKFCRENGIHVSAYSPLGGGEKPNLLEDETLINIAKELNRSTAQVALRWNIQRGLSVLPKSVNESRIISNFEVNFELSEEQMQRINNVSKNIRFINPSCAWKLPFDIFAQKTHSNL